MNEFLFTAALMARVRQADLSHAATGPAARRVEWLSIWTLGVALLVGLVR